MIYYLIITLLFTDYNCCFLENNEIVADDCTCVFKINQLTSYFSKKKEGKNDIAKVGLAVLATRSLQIDK